jgi:hypothetical protein
MIRRLLAYLNADRFWVWIDRFSRIMVFVGIPAFFVNQYIRAEHDRASNTLEFVTRFQDSQLVRYRYRLLAPWMAKNVTALEKAGVVEDM